MQMEYIYDNTLRTYLCFILNFCRTIQDNRNPSDDTVPLLAVEKKKHSLNISVLHLERKIGSALPKYHLF